MHQQGNIDVEASLQDFNLAPASATRTLSTEGTRRGSSLPVLDALTESKGEQEPQKESKQRESYPKPMTAIFSTSISELSSPEAMPTENGRVGPRSRGSGECDPPVSNTSTGYEYGQFWASIDEARWYRPESRAWSEHGKRNGGTAVYPRRFPDAEWNRMNEWWWLNTDGADSGLGLPEDEPGSDPFIPDSVPTDDGERFEADEKLEDGSQPRCKCGTNGHPGKDCPWCESCRRHGHTAEECPTAVPALIGGGVDMSTWRADVRRDMSRSQ